MECQEREVSELSSHFGSSEHQSKVLCVSPLNRFSHRCCVKRLSQLSLLVTLPAQGASAPRL